MQKRENRINSVIETALKHLSEIVDVSTAIGKPIISDSGEEIIPVAKITVGSLNAGGEYGKTGIFKTSSDLPFSAGNGALISIKPFGFLIKNKGGEFKMISVPSAPIEQFIDKTTEIINKLTESNNNE